MTQPPLLDLSPDEAPPERLVWMWRLYGHMPTGHVCGDCCHYSFRTCLLSSSHAANQWSAEWDGCGLWEYAS